MPIACANSSLIGVFIEANKMGKIKDLTGLRFGKLIVIGNKGSKKICKCDCGNICETNTNHLITGHSKSCGCGNARYWKTAKGMSRSNLYKVWIGMKERCMNPNSLSYKYYGGRGIIVCDEWINDSSSFLDWALKNGYKQGLTLDRIDVNKGYEPENCRWVKMKEQCRNTRRNVYIEYNNETLCLKDMCDKYKINYRSVLHYKKTYDTDYLYACFEEGKVI